MLSEYLGDPSNFHSQYQTEDYSAAHEHNKQETMFVSLEGHARLAFGTLFM